MNIFIYDLRLTNIAQCTDTVASAVLCDAKMSEHYKGNIVVNHQSNQVADTIGELLSTKPIIVVGITDKEKPPYVGYLSTDNTKEQIVERISTVVFAKIGIIVTESDMTWNYTPISFNEMFDRAMSIL